MTMAKPRRKKPKHPLLDAHYMEGFLGFGTAEDPADIEAMPWPARVATFVLAFDGQMGNGGSQFWITNEWRVHDPALLAVLSKLRSPRAREVAKLVKKIEKLGARADVLQDKPESARIDAALDRLAERCDAVDQAYYAISAEFLVEVEAELAGSVAKPLKRGR